MMWGFTGKTEKKILQYLQDLDLISVTFFEGIQLYLNGSLRDFTRKKEEVQQRESQLDLQRKEIEWELYSKMLIPESRADIFNLLEDLDKMADLQERIVMQFQAEKPQFSEEIEPSLQSLLPSCKAAVEQVIQASLGFFKNSSDLEQKLSRVGYYEHEADLREEEIKTVIFSSKQLHLSEKIHLRDFVDKLSELADLAEDIADRINIYRIKREN
jgi:predicted phosphate transport protein (TIGR00153 family)